jgi:hypothetical protein
VDEGIFVFIDDGQLTVDHKTNVTIHRHRSTATLEKEARMKKFAKRNKQTRQRTGCFLLQVVSSVLVRLLLNVQLTLCPIPVRAWRDYR